MSVPKLRFEEFQGKWEVKKLEELLLFKNGINATKEQYGKGVKFINVMDIINNDFITHDNIIGCVDVTEKVFEESKVEYGDVLFQRSSETREEVGQTSVYVDKNKSATFGGFVIRGKKIGEYNPIFINFLLKTDLIRKDITDKSGGSTRYNVGQDTLKTVAIHLPSIPEQTKIADFLMAIDEKIAQLTQKNELLSRYKKGVMQLIFSQELRFKDDDGRDFPDWEDKLLQKVISERSEISDSDFPIYSLTIQDGVTPKTDRYEREHLVTDTSNAYKLVKENDFAYNPMNLRFGAIARYSGKNPVRISKYYNVFYCNESFNYSFFEAYFKTSAMISFYDKMSTGSLVEKKRVHFGDFLNFKIPVPTIQEQIKIANFLTAMDEKIIQTQTYLETVKQYKQGLLQQMFI